MSATSNLNVYPQTFNDCCKKAVNGQCNVYDQREPHKDCITDQGLNCEFNKPKTCSRCGYFRRKKDGKCLLGYFTSENSSCCRQALSKKIMYRSGY
jgi:hypothetical protein